MFVGRPALWGLAVGGEAGVRRMLEILRNELEYTLQIAGECLVTLRDSVLVSVLFVLIYFKFFTGTPTVDDITRDMVRHESAYSKI